MKKILLFFALVLSISAVNAQTIQGTEKFKVIDGDTVWSPTLTQLKTFTNTGLGSGSVTSVAMTVPTGLSVAGSPITTSGTLAVTNNMAAGVVHSAGVAGALTSSAVALATEVSGTLPVANGGTGATTLTASALLVGNTTSAVTSLALGTANQVVGMNSGATANEYKTFAAGSTGTDFAIAHAANSVTYNLPAASASASGKVNTSAQSFAGLKTFTEGSVHTGETAVEAAQFNGVEGHQYTAVSTTTTLSGLHNHIGLDSSAGVFTVTLPAVATAGDWVYSFSVVGTGTNLITIDAAGVETFIGGATQKLISGQGTVLKIQCNGTAWLVVD